MTGTMMMVFIRLLHLVDKNNKDVVFINKSKEYHSTAG
jgi:hypothetical protein